MDAGLTQATLADRLDLSQQTVQKYERGGVDFSIERLRDIAKALSCDESKLTAKQKSKDFQKGTPRSRPLTDFEHSFLNELSKIKDLSRKRLALQMVRVIAEAQQQQQ